MKLLLSKFSSPRTLNYLRQIQGSFVFKLLAVLMSFLLVPLMVKFLGNEKYGIWSTLLTLVSWTLFFDFGLANGTRNKVAEAFAKNDYDEARVYISTSYISITVISSVMFFGLCLFGLWIDWQAVFNTNILSSKELRLIVIIISFYILANFILSIINQIFHSIQKTSFVIFGQFLTNFLSVFFVYILLKISSGKMIFLAITFGLPIILTSFLLNFYYFKNNLNLLPKIKYFNTSKIKDLLGLGVKFFVIQLAVLVIFTTDKIIITQILGPEHVTPYDITFKLFSMITILHGLINDPLWSAYTEAYIKKDFSWIKKSCLRMTLLLLPVFAIVLILIFTSKLIIKIWVGPQVIVPDQLIIFFGIFTIISIWNNNWGIILSGIGKVRLGTCYTVVTGLINIPLSVYFAHKFGVAGVILGTICSISISSVISPIQVWYFIFSKKQFHQLERIFS